MEGKLDRLPPGSWGVITRMGYGPRLYQLGLRPGETVFCKYKSRGVMVLKIGKRLLALRRRELYSVWVDY